MGTDGTENQEGVIPVPDSKETPTSYTPEQVKQAVEKATRDARTAVLADAGRIKAEAERALKAARDATDRLDRMQKEQEEAELQNAQGDDDALSAIRARHESRRLKAELDARNAELEAARSQIGEYTNKEREATKQTIAQKVAASQGVDSSLLTRLAKFTDGTEESIEAIAKDLPKAQSKGPESQETFKPDSNRSRGGTPKDKYTVMKDYSAGNINAVQYKEQMNALGLTP